MDKRIQVTLLDVVMMRRLIKENQTEVYAMLTGGMGTSDGDAGRRDGEMGNIITDRQYIF